MPWSDSVDGIAALFLGGQETGNAWASVLFGDHAPTGRLPISIPASEADVIEPSSGTITYSEGLSTGYRNKGFKHVYPFGHGLTYTNFSYADARQLACGSTLGVVVQDVCVSFNLRNIGHVAAATIPQLYLEFPSAAGQPGPILKGFDKTQILQPSQELLVTFRLSNRDLSYWKSGSWIKADSVVAHIGASSADFKLSLELDLAHRVTDEIVV